MRLFLLKKDGHISNTGFALVLIIPSLVVLVGVIAVPLIQGILFSFQEYSLLRPQQIEYIGLENYTRLFADSVFWYSAVATFKFVFGSVSIGFSLGFILALLLNQKIVLQGTIRGLFLIPWITPYIAIAFMLLYMFDGQVGIVNYTLKQLGLISEYKSWLGDGRLAIWVVILGNSWYQFPFHMMTILAGLQSIPESVVDAARVDGAGIFSRFRHITLPFLRNIMVMSTSLMVIFSFKTFALIWTATNGGPFYTTSIFAVYTYQLGFQEFNMGYAAAVGTISLLFLAVFAFIYIKAVEREGVI